MYQISKWLIEASYVEPSSTTTTPTTTITSNITTTNTLDLPLITVASTGIAIGVLAVVVLYRRMQK